MLSSEGSRGNHDHKPFDQAPGRDSLALLAEARVHIGERGRLTIEWSRSFGGGGEILVCGMRGACYRGRREWLGSKLVIGVWWSEGMGRAGKLEEVGPLHGVGKQVRHYWGNRPGCFV